MNHRLCANALLAVMAIVGAHIVGSAQAPGIAGHAVDSAGYAVPGVSVTAVPEGRGTAKRTLTAADGAYQFDGLSDDTYHVDFEILGFDLIRRNHVRVHQDATARVDATLPVSAICECVRVSEGAELRERSGQVVDDAGRPLARARVEITTPLRYEFAYADSQGQFRVRLPVNENWVITASASGFELVKQQVSARTDAPIVLRLSHVGTAAVPDTERFPRPCCPRDLFTYDRR